MQLSYTVCAKTQATFEAERRTLPALELSPDTNPARRRVQDLSPPALDSRPNDRRAGPGDGAAKGIENLGRPSWKRSGKR